MNYPEWRFFLLTRYQLAKSALRLISVFVCQPLQSCIHLAMSFPRRKAWYRFREREWWRSQPAQEVSFHWVKYSKVNNIDYELGKGIPLINRRAMSEKEQDDRKRPSSQPPHFDQGGILNVLTNLSLNMCEMTFYSISLAKHSKSFMYNIRNCCGSEKNDIKKSLRLVNDVRLRVGRGPKFCRN